MVQWGAVLASLLKMGVARVALCYQSRPNESNFSPESIPRGCDLRECIGGSFNRLSRPLQKPESQCNAGNYESDRICQKSADVPGCLNDWGLNAR